MSVYRVGNKSSESPFPKIRPTLDLDFANSKTLDPRITFRRSSSGTYFGPDGRLRYAGVNEPRFDHNPTTGECLGLLVEEQRSNLLVQSEDFSTTWARTGILDFGSGSTLNATTAPTGSTTADLLTEDTSNGDHRVASAAISWTGNAQYTFSVFAKANGRTWLHILFGTAANWVNGAREANYDLVTGTVFSTGGDPVTASITPYGNGWYRCTMTATATASPSSSSLFVALCQPNGLRIYAGDGTSGIYLWGAQLEAGSFPTSYIPTTTAAATRSADVASISGSAFSGWYNATQSTIYSEAASATGAAYSGYVYMIGSSLNDSIAHYRQLDFQPVARVRVASADQYGATGNGAIWTGASVNRFALGLSTTSGRQASNGSLDSAGDDTSIAFPSVSSMTIGALVGGFASINGTIRRLVYWPQRLPNATLQRLTR